MTPIQTIDHCTVELYKHNAADEDVAYAAWVSNFGAEAKKRDISNIGRLINFLYSNLHMSPFEHASFTWFIESPIFVAREFMRHRTWSYNETSGRYKELEGIFYLPRRDRPLVQVGKPGAYRFEQGSNEQYARVLRGQTRLFSQSWAEYQEELSQGIAKEVARNVLPLSTITQYWASANPRNVMQFLTLRNDEQALDEIRGVAVEIEKGFAQAMPLTYEAFSRQRETWQKLHSVLELIDIDSLVELVEKEQNEKG